MTMQIKSSFIGKSWELSKLLSGVYAHFFSGI